jgi:hypothetical protein
MRTAIRLVDLPNDTSFAPLGVLGYCLTRSHFLLPVWADLHLPFKMVDHAPAAKLQDLLTSVLAGCRSISDVNCLLVPDRALARAWGRERFADQSTLARTVDAFDTSTVQQLRQGSERLFRQESRTLRHDFARAWLWLDIDLTPLPISQHAQGSTKGKFNQKNRYGRQLARVVAAQYHETLFSRLYPGKQESSPAYLPTLTALDGFLRLTPEQKQHTVVRSDAGFGSDANINAALEAQWQVLTKNKGGRRPVAYARRVEESAWQALRSDRWVAPITFGPTYVRPTTCLLLRWQTEKGCIKHALVVSSLTACTMQETIAQYDDRGMCETEIQADKAGLRLEQRRKKHLEAQEALVLLTDVAHNVLAWMAQRMFADEPLVGFGTTRLINDALRISGRLYFDGETLTEVQLNRRHMYADAVATGLERLLAHFGYP